MIKTFLVAAFVVFAAGAAAQNQGTHKPDSTGQLTPSFEPAKLVPSECSFSTKIAVMGQNFDLSSTRVVSKASYQGKPIWRVVEQASGPMGSIADTTDIDAVTLFPLRRSAFQGGGTLYLAFTADSVLGRITGGGMDLPIRIRIRGPVVTNGAASELAIGTLPLAVGYSATIQTIDIMKQDPMALSLRVISVDTVKVTAGTFETYRVELMAQGEPGRGVTVWYNTKDRRTIKVETVLPEQMGGGTSITELVK